MCTLNCRVNMKTRAISTFLLISNFFWVRGKVEIRNDKLQNKEDLYEVSLDNIQKIHNWMTNTLANPLNEICRGEKQDNLHDDEVLVMHWPCHLSDAIKK